MSCPVSLSDLSQKHPGLLPLWEIFPTSRLVGGAVRDLLLGFLPKDIDMAVPLPPDEIMARLKKNGQRFIPTGLSHGTVSALIKGERYEITALRQDVATDGRHATVAWTADWQIDAERRDFTINAMSIDKDGKLHDYFGGQADLKKGVVRFVGEAQRRIEEDYLRILRYFRFSARFDKQPPEQDLLNIISQNLRGLAGIAKERIREEFSRFLLGPRIVPTLKAMQTAGVLSCLFSEYDLSLFEAGLRIGAPEDFLLRLYLLCPHKKALEKHFAFSNKEKKRLLFFQSFGQKFEISPDEPLLLTFLDQHSRADLIAYSYLAQAFSLQKNDFRAQENTEKDWKLLRQRLTETELPEFPLTGEDLLEKGVPAGVEIGNWLKKMRHYWLSEKAQPNARQILAHFGL